MKQALKGTFHEISFSNPKFTIQGKEDYDDKEYDGIDFKNLYIKFDIFIPNLTLLRNTIEREKVNVFINEENQVNILTNIIISMSVMRILIY